ncbi:ABC transporter permease [Halobacteria archaeon AArc-m2/3/4]|uniref:ABC transporter permease n=1 Tax=Natronoglomus mannanivorans TaxID=2979990 RepID=A0AAP2Z103_9EURY|nr:ABC transporter permease [Halobacteria archaeon AArc-xg1-1]MCU4972258.1 ABC transporter permease [Halobacteria archaeon AArc-m2/3/4]
MSYDEHDDETFRERIDANPRPALIWIVGLIVLLAVELGRIVDGIIALGGAIRFALSGIAAGPSWIGDNVAGTLGSAVGTGAMILTALLLLAIAGSLVKTIFVPGSPLKRLGYDIDQTKQTIDLLDRLFLTAILAVIALLAITSPFSGVLESGINGLTRGLESVSSLPTITGRETISNEGHRTPGGGWEGTFLGLSPAWAWALRVLVVYAYAFVALAWLWKGYTIFREHYREADWTPRDDSINRFRNHYWGIFGLIIVFMFVVMAIWAPALGPVDAEHNLYSPYEHEFEYLDDDTVVSTTHGTANLQSQSQGGESTIGLMSYDDFDRWAPFGTNQDGKDLFTFLVFGARTSLVIGVTAIGLATAIALAMSLITAYYKGLVDTLTIITSDTIISIPAFLLVLLLSVIFQQANHPIADVYNGGLLLALIFAGIYWPGLWRSIRGPSLQVAEQEWVDAAKSYGQTPAMTMRKHMAPYIATYIMIYASLLLGGVIIATAALSFLGLGINPPTPEWGRMVSDGRSYVSTTSWHIATIPGIMIVFVVTGFNALGDGIRDAMDPESDTGTSDAGAAASGGGG